MRVLPIANRISFSKSQPLRLADEKRKEDIESMKKAIGMSDEGSEAIKKKSEEEKLKEIRASRALSIRPHKKEDESVNKYECKTVEELKKEGTNG